MIYNPTTEVIQGISYSCFKNMGIPASLVSGSSSTAELMMNMICPEIVDPDNQKELSSPNGMIVSIDTTSIQQNFLLEDEEGKDERDEDEDLMTCVRTTSKRNRAKSAPSEKKSTLAETECNNTKFKKT